MKFLNNLNSFFQKARKIKCVTVEYTLYNSTFFLIYLPLLIVYLCKRKDWQLGIRLVALFVIGVILAYLLGSILNKTVKQNKNLEDDEKCRIYMMTLSGSITVIGIVYIILLFIPRVKAEAIIPIYISVLFPLLLSSAIIPKLPVCYIYYEHHTCTVFSICLLHTIFLLLNFWHCFFQPFSSDTISPHILYLCWYAPSSLDFIIAMNGGVKIGDFGLIEEEKERKDKERFERELIKQLKRMEISTVSGMFCLDLYLFNTMFTSCSVIFRPECKICFSEFHNHRVPYVLKECGHTICEICSYKLLQKQEQYFVICPFCRKTTTSEEPESVLLINHSIKEFMKENVKEKYTYH
ncbi:hypothetical protein CAEBREN_12513 [Caenorhabditis brenneri]|uniref:RING-type domain-containing protein n=1 Tax=Caenorhabditis brenneri TaxID=135651 RepID=G0N804_CAEBE|nr:hypothetical protein CAEBREN_12513 [Caenorhabditis brenneri]